MSVGIFTAVPQLEEHKEIPRKRIYVKIMPKRRKSSQQAEREESSNNKQNRLSTTSS